MFINGGFIGEQLKMLDRFISNLVGLSLDIVDKCCC